ncbi:hypothetical protein SAMN02746066_04545 [Anaerosporobacter mobilis DSM 15930]|jgi:hypothetical protein|uniref:Phage coat protein n=1 Tax=Anaerosporobacter mobilis DSM 15930 TaxID=1120996 RepID=A0A1M7NJE8_9FIRM|nr:phage coat protein [Anaerosporobacter mobilis]SHN03813.1 hypothetical protein SAMN02746066_04545 [Anaerosporobacter mobilis DSM 15930]
MPGIFDSKNFNSEVFMAYADKTPNLNRNELIKSKAIRQRQDIASKFADQVGGNYATVPITGRIGGKAQNYNGSTDIEAKKLKTFTQGRIVVGRADAWVETDFGYDITGGTDFLAQVASQVGEYWDDIDQATLLSVLKGIFSMTGAKNLEFVNGHTYDISDKTDGTGVFGPVTLNNAIQKALGDNKAKFTLAIMHSAVATGLENLNLLEYMKYTDKDGIERSLPLATLNGKLVLVDDTMPVEEVPKVGEVEAYTKYTSYVLGDGAIEYTDCGAKVPYETDRDPAKNGGQDTLYGRQRKIFSPYGISFTDSSILSPTDANLETGSKWSLANSNESGSAEYFPHKAIPIARVITRG